MSSKTNFFTILLNSVEAVDFKIGHSSLCLLQNDSPKVIDKYCR